MLHAHNTSMERHGGHVVTLSDRARLRPSVASLLQQRG
jgi:hypothetical protein